MKFSLVFALFFGGFGALFAAENSPQTAPVLRAELAADFKQTINTADGKITYQGSALLDGSEWFWRINSPEKKRVCGDAAGAILIDDDLEQVQKIRGGVDIAQLASKAQNLGGGRFAARVNDRDYFIAADAAGSMREIAYTDEFGADVLVVFAPPAAEISRDCAVPAGYDEVAE